METKAPIKKAKNKATKIFGQPRIRPIKKANLTSPTPIHLPRETKIIKRKNAPAIKPAIIKLKRDSKFSIFNFQFSNNR